MNYESAKGTRLACRENPKVPLNWCVEKIRPSKDKSPLAQKDFLTLEGILRETPACRLGSRSALKWRVDEYQVRTGRRSGIATDPNRSDAQECIVRQIGQAVTLNLVRALPPPEEGGAGWQIPICWESSEVILPGGMRFADA